MIGKGKIHYANGAVYKGEFLHDRIDGFGSYTTEKGKKYVGTWK